MCDFSGASWPESTATTPRRDRHAGRVEGRALVTEDGAVAGRSPKGAGLRLPSARRAVRLVSWTDEVLDCRLRRPLATFISASFVSRFDHTL